MNASKPHSLGFFCNSFLSEGKRRVIVTHFCQKMHSLSLLYQSMRPWCLSIPEHMWFAVLTYKMCVFVFLFSASGSPYMCVRSAMWNFLYAAFFSLIMCTVFYSLLLCAQTQVSTRKKMELYVCSTVLPGEVESSLIIPAKKMLRAKVQ